MKRLALALGVGLMACSSSPSTPSAQRSGAGATTPAPTVRQQAEASARARLFPFAQAAQIPSAAAFSWAWWDGQTLLQSQQIRAETWEEFNDFRADFGLSGPEWSAFERELKAAFPLGLTVEVWPGVACQGDCEAFSVVTLGRADWGTGGFVSTVQRDY